MKLLWSFLKKRFWVYISKGNLWKSWCQSFHLLSSLWNNWRPVGRKYQLYEWEVSGIFQPEWRKYCWENWCGRFARIVPGNSKLPETISGIHKEASKDISDCYEKKYLLSFYMNGILAVIKDWMSGNCEDDIDFIVKFISERIHPKER